MPDQHPTPSEPTASKTPLADLRRAALAHYDEAATATHMWHSVIPRAINFYFDAEEAKERAPTPSEGGKDK